jgi:hypothetical protein
MSQKKMVKSRDSKEQHATSQSVGCYYCMYVHEKGRDNFSVTGRMHNMVRHGWKDDVLT